MKVIVVLGATATGKTDLAVRIAKHLKTEIINFDSLQVYRKMDIGTAKPTKALLSEVPHHLIDIRDPNYFYTAGDFKRDAEKILKDLNTKGLSHAVVVGGTGFYLQALIKGMYDVPDVSDIAKAQTLSDMTTRGALWCLNEIVERDPEYAKKLHPNDTYRITRALEIMRSGSKTITEIQTEFRKQKFAYPLQQIGLRRTKPRLLESITKRTKGMIQAGLIDEADRIAKEFGSKIRPLQSVGYREAMQYLEGLITDDGLEKMIIQNTMALAKRQSTWFKRDPDIQWFDPDEKDFTFNDLSL